MKEFFLLLALLLLCAACALEQPRPLMPLTDYTQLSPQETNLQKACTAVYPEGKWQFVHSIEFRMAGGGGSSVVGVTVLDGNTLNCALMTIEGFTLFEARLTDRLEVVRAVPPFDKPEFAAGLMNDVRAIFIRPPEYNVHYGRLADNMETCRMTAVDGRVTDILPSEDGCWRIKTYGSGGRLTRTITARSCRTMGAAVLPGELELTVPGRTGYTLNMTLINADSPAMEQKE